ncbi:hypothetical protein NDU88_002414 [Pleurodeles waltl]|uniref:Uncharacterized protein n=1 Tax=Pleurodeles waltl TaxID=8319 RepID=A0AAV7NH37_PLEWA|nr:hypothetical protein NDU88_002414 [Pleurodeles waltl]
MWPNPLSSLLRSTGFLLNLGGSLDCRLFASFFFYGKLLKTMDSPGNQEKNQFPVCEADVIDIGGMEQILKARQKFML